MHLNWDEITKQAWPTPERVTLHSYEPMVDKIGDLVAWLIYGTTDPHEIFVENLRERATPMFVVSCEESLDTDVAQRIERYVSRMQARPVIAEGSFSVNIDIGLHPDEYRERLEFYDQPCMYAEGD